MGSILCQAGDGKELMILPILLDCPVLNSPDEQWSQTVVEVIGRGMLELHRKQKDRLATLGIEIVIYVLNTAE